MSLQSLIQELNPVNGKIPKHMFEAYCTEAGYLEASYLSYLFKQRLTQKGLNSQVNKMLGAASFLPDEENKLPSMTFEQFAEMYQFAKVPRVRDYIMQAADKGLLLTRENLFGWIQSWSDTEH